MQLVAYGAQDIYLTGNPQITFFKVVYRRHTNFSMEAIEQTWNGPSGGATAARCTATISRNGDLVHKMYLELVGTLDAGGLNPGTSGIDDVEIEYGAVPTRVLAIPAIEVNLWTFLHGPLPRISARRDLGVELPGHVFVLSDDLVHGDPVEPLIVPAHEEDEPRTRFACVFIEERRVLVEVCDLRLRQDFLKHDDVVITLGDLLLGLRPLPKHPQRGAATYDARGLSAGAVTAIRSEVLHVRPESLVPKSEAVPYKQHSAGRFR